MKFANTVTVAAPPDDLFAFVADIERVAPCLPGAKIDGREGDDFLGSMKVKVGPIVASYKGTMRFLELDATARRAVMKARADEVTGNGAAEAQITTAIEEVDGGSLIRLETDLQVRGRVAQFGRGAMEKISERMLQQFAQNIERAFTPQAVEDQAAPQPQPQPQPEPAAAARDVPATPEIAATARPIAQSSEPEPLDALGLVGGPLVERLQRGAPFALVALLGILYGYLLGRLRSQRG